MNEFSKFTNLENKKKSILPFGKSILTNILQFKKSLNISSISIFAIFKFRNIGRCTFRRSKF